MKNISAFQIGIFAACVIGAVFAVLIFSGKLPIGESSSTTVAGSVTVWGTLPYDAMKSMTDVVTQNYNQLIVDYVQKDPNTFQSDLVNALASGTGPDLVLLTPTDIIPNQARILTIPYASLPQATFDSTFIDQGSLFTNDTGVLAFPMLVDPMVMFYNKDMLSASFSVNPPKTWDDVVALNKKITQKDDGGQLTTETVALGSYANILHAKDILANLILQAGNPIVTWDPIQKKYISTFGNTDQAGNSGVEQALQFYTNFANPNDTDHYSWNATLPTDQDQFVAGKLAIYFGYASEIEDLRAKNPNLNFGVELMPQRASVPTKGTYGRMVGIAIMKMSQNPSIALTAAQTLVSQNAIKAFLDVNPSFSPARKDMLAVETDDAVKTTIDNSSIISKSFLDPDPIATDQLFSSFIRQINSGVAQPGGIITPGDSLLSGILDKVQKQTAAAAPTPQQ